SQAFDNVADSEVLLNLKKSESVQSLPLQLHIVSWNIEKAKKKEKWRQDFIDLTSGSDLVLLQEGMSDNYLPSVLIESEQTDWWMAQSWRDKKGYSTGVITGSVGQSISQHFLRSPDAEPIANTPKMSLVQTYRLENGEILLLINVHGINFVLTPSFKKQMNEILKVIDAGLVMNPNMKIVFAGDFNTWNVDRMRFIAEELNKRSFAHVVFEQDQRRMKLDHVFVKGCSIETAVLHSKIKTSDHFPVSVDLDCAKETGIGWAVDASHQY
ncbi:MAG: endonuclease/exonuclease/phosphatase family protein, partial [Bdellovibrionota bacterium]